MYVCMYVVQEQSVFFLIVLPCIGNIRSNVTREHEETSKNNGTEGLLFTVPSQFQAFQVSRFSEEEQEQEIKVKEEEEIKVKEEEEEEEIKVKEEEEEEEEEEEKG